MKLSALKSLESFKKNSGLLNSRIWMFCHSAFRKMLLHSSCPLQKGLILRKTMGLLMVSRAKGTVSKHPGSMTLPSRRWEEIWSPLFTFLTLSICNQRNPNYFQNCIFKGVWETFLAFPLLKSRRAVKKLSESICNIQYKH